MPREIVKYGQNGVGSFTEWGNVPPGVDHARLFTLLDQLQDFYGHRMYEKRIDIDPSGEAVVTIQFSGQRWVEREERADRLQRMLRWLVLKMSAEELRYLGVLPMTAEPSSYSVEQLMKGLEEQFDEFARADDRLRGKRGLR